MLEEIIQKGKNQLKLLKDVRNIALYIFVLIVIAITWSSIKTVQKNYDLQKQIATLKQQNSVIKLENQNIGLNNKYLQTDQYLELTARQSLGLALPGEKVMVIPKRVALKYADPSILPENSAQGVKSKDQQSKYIKNIEAWRDFLLGRKLSS